MTGSVNVNGERPDKKPEEFIRFQDEVRHIVESDITKDLNALREIAGLDTDIALCEIDSVARPLSLDTQYHLLRSYYYADVGFLWALYRIYYIIVEAIDAIRWFLDLIRVAEIIQLHEILYQLWPQYREWIDQLYSKISEISGILGWGLDGLGHLLNAAQGGISFLEGVSNRDWGIFQFQRSERYLSVLSRLEIYAKELEDDPSRALDMLFLYEDKKTWNNAYGWWEETSTWIQNAADTALLAIGKVNDTIDDFKELENNMPAFVRDNIPQSLLNAVDWLDTMIDDKILPGLARINTLFDEIDAVLEAQREKMERLAEELTRPGDLLLRIKQLREDLREDQERKLDDAVSGEFQREVDKEVDETLSVWEEFDRIHEALTVEVPAPSFLTLEDMEFKPLIIPGEPQRDTWFVGDY